MQRRDFLAAVGAAGFSPLALAHHGWSSFDQDKPLYLEGRAEKVSWRNPHVEIVLAVPADLKLPADLTRRSVPAQSATVDGPRILGAAKLPTRRERTWEIELAPLTRMEAWKVAEIKPGQTIAVIGYAHTDEKGDAVLSAEYLFADGRAYGLRSSPA